MAPGFSNRRSVRRDHMNCAHCGERIEGKAVKQSGDFFCSLECAYRAAGLNPEEDEEYFDEDNFEGYNDDDD